MERKEQKKSDVVSHIPRTLSIKICDTVSLIDWKWEKKRNFICAEESTEDVRARTRRFLRRLHQRGAWMWSLKRDGRSRGIARVRGLIFNLCLWMCVWMCETWKRDRKYSSSPFSLSSFFGTERWYFFIPSASLTHVSSPLLSRAPITYASTRTCLRDGRKHRETDWQTELTCMSAYFFLCVFAYICMCVCVCLCVCVSVCLLYRERLEKLVRPRVL